MSRIRGLVEPVLLAAERGYPPEEFHQKMLLLEALDILVDSLDGIKDGLKEVEEALVVGFSRVDDELAEIEAHLEGYR